MKAAAASAPTAKYCPYCTGRLRSCRGVPRCTLCRAVVCIKFSCFARRSPGRGESPYTAKFFDGSQRLLVEVPLQLQEGCLTGEARVVATGHVEALIVKIHDLEFQQPAYTWMMNNNSLVKGRSFDVRIPCNTLRKNTSDSKNDARTVRAVKRGRAA